MQFYQNHNNNFCYQGVLSLISFLISTYLPIHYGPEHLLQILIIIHKNNTNEIKNNPAQTTSTTIPPQRDCEPMQNLV